MSKNTGDGELEPDELDLILGELQNYMVEVKRTIKAKAAIKKWAAQEANKAQQQLLKGLMEQAKTYEVVALIYGSKMVKAVPLSVIQNKLEGLS